MIKTIIAIIIAIVLIGFTLIMMTNHSSESNNVKNKQIADQKLPPGTKNQTNIESPKSPQKNVPVIDFPELEFDFGNVPQDTTINHIFLLRNIGDSPLKIISTKGT